MDANDARYELPCRVMLALAAVIHWVYAGLALRKFNTAEVESFDVYARSLDVVMNCVYRTFS